MVGVWAVALWVVALWWGWVRPWAWRLWWPLLSLSGSRLRVALLPPLGWRSLSVKVVVVVLVLVGLLLMELAPGEARVGSRGHRESVSTEVGGERFDDGASLRELASRLLPGQLRQSGSSSRASLHEGGPLLAAPLFAVDVVELVVLDVADVRRVGWEVVGSAWEGRDVGVVVASPSPRRPDDLGVGLPLHPRSHQG